MTNEPLSQDLESLNSSIQELTELKNKTEQQLRKQRNENLFTSGFYTNASWVYEHRDESKYIHLRYVGKFPSDVWNDLIGDSYKSWTEICPNIYMGKEDREDDYYSLPRFYLYGEFEHVKDFVKKFNLKVSLEELKYEIEDFESQIAIRKNIIEEWNK